MSKPQPKKPKHPSYEDGELHDPSVVEMQDWYARKGDDQRSALHDLIKRSAAQDAPEDE